MIHISAGRLKRILRETRQELVTVEEQIQKRKTALAKLESREATFKELLTELALNGDAEAQTILREGERPA